MGVYVSRVRLREHLKSASKDSGSVALAHSPVIVRHFSIVPSTTGWCIKHEPYMLFIHRASRQFWKQLVTIIAVKSGRVKHLNIVFIMTTHQW